MKLRIGIMLLSTLWIACATEELRENPADYAGDYALDDHAFHSVIKEEYSEIPPTQQTPPPPPRETDNLKLIKTAFLSVQVNDLKQASRELDSLVTAFNAYISNDELQNSPNRKNRNLTIRVPASQLEVLLEQLSGVGEYLDRRSLNVRDVSEDYVDTELRLKSKRAVLDQYLKLLDRANQMEDVLKIENEIRLIREEIEAKEGHLRYLSDQVALSTIYLEMYQDIQHAEGPPSENFWRRAGEKLVFGWELIQVLVLGLLSIWPILVLISGVVFFIVHRKRRTAESHAG